ncbi:methyltransferase domain-containing protein [Actinomadura rubrisoli]|uniref:methyltransferase domain-containing protein n=1 Tax=Actinomadura rubrisoli TaxID=2530368 RepID=UPI001A9DBF22|nr:methyltransferase domain-containing protein [Actinomadura rubrisoli]
MGKHSFPLCGTGWGQVLEATPRCLFLPDLIWPLDASNGRYETIDRAADPDGWRAWADADVPIVTQWDDGRHTGREPGTMATSSASQPSLVVRMLAALDVEPGHRVLDVGVGTGWTTGLLAARAGAANVTGIEFDARVAEAARARLDAIGVDPKVITGDGAAGWAPAAPYDRLQGTYGVLRIPPAWIDQTRHGGLIVAPWRTPFVHGGAVVRLTVNADGSASGPFTGAAEFMQSRPERFAWVAHTDYIPSNDAWPVGTAESRTSLRPDDLRTLDGAAEFVIGCAVPDVVHTISDDDDGTTSAWFYELNGDSWAVVYFDQDPEAEVYQGGPRRLWDEIEAAHRWWAAQGRPEHERFGLTVGPAGESVWLDNPHQPIPGGRQAEKARTPRP